MTLGFMLLTFIFIRYFKLRSLLNSRVLILTGAGGNV